MDRRNFFSAFLGALAYWPMRRADQLPRIPNACEEEPDDVRRNAVQGQAVHGSVSASEPPPCVTTVYGADAWQRAWGTKRR